MVTPSNPDNTVNTVVLRHVIDYHMDKEVDGFYVGGSTGEGVFMPVSQRKLLAETVISHVNGRVPVILHIGAVSVDDAIDLAIHAQEKGAAGISSIIPPLYRNLDVVVEYYVQIARAAPTLPFMPYILNSNFNAVELLKRLSKIENLAGSKYTGPNMYEFRQILDLGDGRWTMFSGMDEQSVYAAMMGSSGAIGSTLNIMPGAYKKIRQYVKSGQHHEAQMLQLRVNRVTETLISVGFAGALKIALSQITGQAIGNPRLPQMALASEQIDILHEKLATTDFDELVAM